jgi:hypothetical protein
LRSATSGYNRKLLQPDRIAKVYGLGCENGPKTAGFERGVKKAGSRERVSEDAVEGTRAVTVRL